MGRRPLNKDAIAMAQQQGKKIDRRRKEFRNLPKPKKRRPNYGPPSHILRARIDPKFEEMRRRREEEGGVLLGGGGLTTTTTTTTSSGGGEEEKRGEEEEEEAWREADVVAKKKQQQQQQQQQQQSATTATTTTATTTTTTLEKNATMNEEEVKNEEKKAAMSVLGTASNSRSNNNDNKNNEDATALSRERQRKREALRKEEEEIERQKKDDAKWRPVCLSRPTMAKGIELMDDGRMVASSQKGYRCVQGTRGVEPAVREEEEDEDEGAIEEKATTTTTMARYFEVKIEHLGESGCVRVGWMTKRGEMNAPVGFDNKGYGYHAETGSKYHEARLKTYGDPYGEGDVVGCYLYLDEKIVKKKEQVEVKETSGGEGPRGDEAKKKQTPSTPERNKKNRREEERLKAKALEESQNPPNEGKIAFYKNGKFQGIAFESLRSCTHPKKPELSGYFPTAALYTTPLQDQSQRARVSFNFGPDFAFPIDAEKDGLPKCSGFSPDLDPPKPPPPPPALEKAELGEGALALESSEGVVKTEEGKEVKQSTSRSDGERGSPRARSKDEACGVPEKQPPESKEKKEEKEEKEEEVKKEKAADVVMKEEEEEEEEVNDHEKVNATSEEAKEKEQTEIKQEAKEEEEVQEFGKLSNAVEPASFSRGGEDGPEPARGLDAFVVEANASPVTKEEEEEDAGEAQKQDPPEAAGTVTTTRDDDNQLFSENMDVETNDDNEEDDGNIGYNWLSG